MRTIAAKSALTLICLCVVSMTGSAEPVADPTLVLHYVFDEAPGEVAQDRSSYGNHGKIVGAHYLQEVAGQRGVLRFDGESAYIDCGDAESLHFGGDMSFEMLARLNGPVKPIAAYIFGENPVRSYCFDLNYWYSLNVLYYNYTDGPEGMMLPVERKVLSDTWSRLAVVIEYPRCRFYQDGELVRDMYMPIPGIQKIGNTHKQIGGLPDGYTPMDLHEFRLYRRALTAAEVAAHAKGQEILPGKDEELAVEPNWYQDTVAARLTCKGSDFKGHAAEIVLLHGDHTAMAAPQKVALEESSEGSGRYVGAALFPLSTLKDKSVDVAARILGPDGKLIKTVYRHACVEKPAWVRTKEGYSDGVLPPWTPLKMATAPDGAVELSIWGRKIRFGTSLLPRQIETRGEQILASPIVLAGSANGEEINWKSGPVRLLKESKTQASLDQTCESAQASLSLNMSVEYDGYMIFDFEFKARRDLTIDALFLDIPLRTRNATLCYGDSVYPPNDEIPMAQWYSDAVRGDLAFRFSPGIWLGDEERGLCWQAESDQDWNCADAQKAIEILPRGETTSFRANLVNVPTRLAAGEALHYKFALLATPVKPMLRDGWDLRIARSEPYGGDLDLPDFQTDGKPTLDYYRDVGVRHLFNIISDVWGYPMPVHDRYSRALHRLIDESHARGVGLYSYLIYVGFPVVVPEFDLYGLDMAKRPLQPYVESINSPGSERAGPVTMKYGADSQATVLMCPKSRALQDAFVHSLARRMDEYADDGLYMDGTDQNRLCRNMGHGCGYRAKDGSIHPTYATFAVREFMKRIYTVVHSRRPNGIVDHHCSFAPNQAALAYGDVYWTGEHWYHLRNTGAKGGYVAGEMTLEKFRTEFMGYQIGTPAEILAYRLGPSEKVASIALLHDVPVRPSTTMARPPSLPPVENKFFVTMTKLWKLRDDFGAREAEKLFYWKNQEYVRVAPEKCYATLFRHPENGLLAVVSNLSPDAQTLTVRLNLGKLKLKGQPLRAFNALSNEPVAMTEEGALSVALGSCEWAYIWLKPTATVREPR